MANWAYSCFHYKAAKEVLFTSSLIFPIFFFWGGGLQPGRDSQILPKYKYTAVKHNASPLFLYLTFHPLCLSLPISLLISLPSASLREAPSRTPLPVQLPKRHSPTSRTPEFCVEAWRSKSQASSRLRCQSYGSLLSSCGAGCMPPRWIGCQEVAKKGKNAHWMMNWYHNKNVEVTKERVLVVSEGLSVNFRCVWLLKVYSNWFKGSSIWKIQFFYARWNQCSFSFEQAINHSAFMSSLYPVRTLHKVNRSNQETILGVLFCIQRFMALPHSREKATVSFLSPSSPFTLSLLFPFQLTKSKNLSSRCCSFDLFHSIPISSLTSPSRVWSTKTSLINPPQIAVFTSSKNTYQAFKPYPQISVSVYAESTLGKQQRNSEKKRAA